MGYEDRVHKYKRKFYFWDEVWSDRHGPYSTKRKARIALARYCKEVIGV